MTGVTLTDRFGMEEATSAQAPHFYKKFYCSTEAQSTYVAALIGKFMKPWCNCK